jgi:hypothetical protein
MNRISSSISSNSMTLALLITVLMVSTGVSAKAHKPKKSNNQAHVVAHLSLTGLSAVDMAMQRKANDKYYLYVQHSRDQGITVIDVTKPLHPKAVGVTPWPDPAQSSRMNVTGDLAIIAENDIPVMRSVSSNEDLVFWDLSNPAAPQVVQKFSGVVKWLQDERNFVYVLNGEGLWVVSKPADRQQDQSDSSDSYGG